MTFFAFFIKLITISAPVLFEKPHSQSNWLDKKCKKSFFLIEKIPQKTEMPSSVYYMVHIRSKLIFSDRNCIFFFRKCGGQIFFSSCFSSWCRRLLGRGHFQYFLNFFNNKKWFFSIFYQVNNPFLHQSYLKSPHPIQ